MRILRWTALALALGTTPVAAATDLSRHVFGSGGTELGTTTTQLRGTAGQRLIGRIGGGGTPTGLRAGFWYGSLDPVTAIGPTLPLPGVPVLHQNTPNPFNPATIITFSLPEEGTVWLDVFDLKGRHVTTLVEGTLPAGQHEMLFAPRALASGVYFYRLRADGFDRTRRMLLLK